MTSSPIIRRAQLKDLPALEVCIAEAWTGTNSEHLPGATLDGLAADDALTHFLKTRISEIWIAVATDKAITGMIGVDAHGFVWGVYVRPNHQRRGTGRLLLEAITDHFRSQHCPALTLDLIETNTSARAFYDALGWHESGRRQESLPDHTADVLRLTLPL